MIPFNITMSVAFDLYNTAGKTSMRYSFLGLYWRQPPFTLWRVWDEEDPIEAHSTNPVNCCRICVDPCRAGVAQRSKAQTPSYTPDQAAVSGLDNGFKSQLAFGGTGLAGDEYFDVAQDVDRGFGTSATPGIRAASREPGAA